MAQNRQRRVTGTLLDVLEVLVLARQDDTEVFGGELVKQTGHSGPAVYQILRRLAQDEWVSRRWEADDDAEGRPRRRFYALTDKGAAGALAVLQERRPEALNPKRRQFLPIPGIPAPGAAT
jgi:DNA-binding MarR family transcriptional regulator